MLSTSLLVSCIVCGVLFFSGGGTSVFGLACLVGWVFRSLFGMLFCTFSHGPFLKWLSCLGGVPGATTVSGTHGMLLVYLLTKEQEYMHTYVHTTVDSGFVPVPTFISACRVHRRTCWVSFVFYFIRYILFFACCRMNGGPSLLLA